MDGRIAKLNLFTKDYRTQEKVSIDFNGEVVLQDEDFKQYFYKFYQIEDGQGMSVDINFKEDEIKIEERNDVVFMKLSFKKNTLMKCTYEFLDNGLKLEMKTKLFESTITPELVEFVYDLYDSKDVEHPLTRNVLTIRNEAKKNLC